MSPSTTKQKGNQMQQLQRKKANYGKEIEVTMEDAQEETKEGILAEEYQCAQKENITTAEHKEHLNNTIKAEEEAWQEEDTDDQRGWDAALEEEKKCTKVDHSTQTMKTTIATYIETKRTSKKSQQR
eukprot:6031187-Ditylum_brightwellii.AAC.1